jgi:hypothetical protein
LIQPAVAAREHLYTRGLPFGDARLDIVDDEAHMVHHRTLGATLSFRGSEVQIDIQSREHDHRVSARDEQLAAHAKKYFFVGFHVLRGEMPVAHGHPGLVEWGRLRGRDARGERRSDQ